MVEIIPKTFEQIPAWQRILFYFLAFFLIANTVGYFILKGNHKDSDAYLVTIEERIKGEVATSIEGLRERLLQDKKKIEDFSVLLENHTFSDKFFEFIEAKTHLDVYFSEANILPQETRVVLYGKAKSFYSLGQQILIFEESDSVKRLVLSEVSINKEREVEFSFDIYFEQEFFEYQPKTE